MIDLCLECPHDKDRETCEKLCPEAEEWAAQDHVKQDGHHLVYVAPKTLDYLADKQTLTHEEMVDDSKLGIKEWHYVKKCGLTDQQMQCMWLYYWEEHTQVEIAELLDISQPTVNQHLEYGRKKLKKLLQTL